MLKAFIIRPSLFQYQFNIVRKLASEIKMENSITLEDVNNKINKETSVDIINQNKTERIPLDNEDEVICKKIKLDNNELSESVTNISTNDKSLFDPKKRKYALLIGYCGEGYFGLQR